MLRSVVSCAVGVFAISALACSDATNPTADSTMRRAQAAAATPIPFAPNVHTAAIPAFDNPDFQPAAMNDLGEIVGDSALGVAFHWEADRGLTTLHIPQSLVVAKAVNNRAQVAIEVLGNGVPPEFYTVGTWDWSGAVQLLRPLTVNATCFADAINDSGVIVGTCGGGGHLPSAGYATLWTAFGTPDALHIGGGSTLVPGEATAITDAGLLAVSAENGNGSLFTAAKMSIPIPPAGASFPAAVNDSGGIAGKVTDANTVSGFDAAVWTNDDSLHNLGEGAMHAISKEGIAVGTVKDPATSVSYPVIWTAAHGTQRLPGLEGGPGLARESGTAIAINARHQILGSVVLSTGGGTRWVLWTLPF